MPSTDAMILGVWVVSMLTLSAFPVILVIIRVRLVDAWRTAAGQEAARAADRRLLMWGLPISCVAVVVAVVATIALTADS